jgi:arsenical pump membrane protein
MAGALLMLMVLPGSPWELVGSSLTILLRPVIIIISLMVMTLVAQRAGLFDRLLQMVLRLARGDGRRLFFWLFWSGVLTGALCTNDAAVLILTPMVCLMLRNLPGLSPLPFLFAVLNIANLVAAFVISNPINIVVAHYFDIDFLDYAAWMFLPAMAAAVSTYLALRWYFRREISASRLPVAEATTESLSPFARWCVGLIAVMVLAVFLGPRAGLPLWVVMSSGACVLLLVGRVTAGINPLGVARGVAWDVLVFVVGFFILVNGLRMSGISGHIGALIGHLAGDHPIGLVFSTGMVAALSSALMNNHPTAYLMALTIHDMGGSPLLQKVLAFAQLIGGDLGPKMLPIGSLAALLWFRILRDHGITVPYRLYVKIGVPVTLIALFLALSVLAAEVYFMGLASPAM